MSTMSSHANTSYDDSLHEQSFSSSSSKLTPQDAYKSTITLSTPARAESLIRKRMSKLLLGKEEEWTAIKSKTGPLQLLDLSVDVLREIVKEITHTNDLTALALTHSALHRLAIPHIYSRFDIVWPDMTLTNDSRSGVDALTYGLATLVMHQDNFPARMTRRIGNDFTRHTRKFSLGNGPSEWVQEYSIQKESGKMLGTLVALAVARMVSLEQFIWDMPTGVLRDVWLALSSLEHRRPPGECRLEKVLVRWHDNSADTPLPGPPPPITNLRISNIGMVIDADTAPNWHHAAYHESSNRVEYPTFSVLPPIKSLSVLDIDELSYLDEMSLAIEKSRDCLRELRVGISQKAQVKDFVMPWDGPDLYQIGKPSGSIHPDFEKRLGGVLGILLGRIYDIRPKASKSPHESQQANSKVIRAISSGDEFTMAEADATHFLPDVPLLPQTTSDAFSDTEESHPKSQPECTSAIVSTPKQKLKRSHTRIEQEHKSPSGVLRLQTLELERVPLSTIVLQKAFDWSVLTSLTLLNCPHHELLWRTLRNQFAPISVHTGLGNTGTKPILEYSLNLKKIHTNRVTISLIKFLKETLAPNSLEVLFLQDRERASAASPEVTIEQIYKGPIRRHRKSLQKLLIDSSDHLPRAPGVGTSKYKKWTIPYDLVTFITSGCMCNLRELSIAINYKDWHYFLRRLPSIPTLRSLNIPFVVDHVTTNYDPRELALQVVNMIHIYPQLQLCYLGISHKCFEILENRLDSPPRDDDSQDENSSEDGEDHEDNASEIGDIPENDIDDEEADGGELHSDEIEAATPGYAVYLQNLADVETTSTTSSAPSSAASINESPRGPNLRLREILYYDDKVAIFKARHMKL